ncbi:hypothetical protein D187_003889 [Cystobacter fuscus DSM 2262]|uniref:Uncharacterized protein n=1 Tax=Cystobacter fuscus (strain ATCC 25194 / DSM 2262 / NBRC 100088 / M29) TaxID=1242864 RepID=S9P6A2_CYSF2|nr:hypothetical protein D187_003889 [Cystobacter fuscus DSM 2262]
MHHLQRPARVVRARVRVVQALARRGHDADGQRLGDPPARVVRLAQHPPQVLAVDVLHGDEVGAVGLPELVHLGDVGVVELGGDERFVAEHLDEFRVLRQVRQDALDHHVLGEPLDAPLAREPHLGHAASGELLDELVFPKELRVHPG